MLRNTTLRAAAVALVSSLGACTAGVGAPAPRATDEVQPPSIDHNEPAGPSPVQAPPTKSATQAPTTSSGGPPACAPCDATFTCSGTVAGAQVTQGDLRLSTKNGVCQGDGILLMCDGSVVIAADTTTVSGTWVRQGDGFTLSGEAFNVTCTPSGPAAPPKGTTVDGGGGPTVVSIDAG